MTRSAIFGLLSMALLAGCAGGGLSDLQQYVEEVKAREPRQIDPLPELKQVETYVYKTGERRTPFHLGGGGLDEDSVKPTSGISPDPLRRKEELEQFPLDSLRMVGSLEEEDTIWALVTARDGTLFRVHAGNYMGENHGQITHVSEDQIGLTEIVPDGTSGWKERQASVALSE